MPLWNSGMLYLCKCSWHLELNLSIIRKSQWSSSCRIFFFHLTFITHWFLLNFLPVAIYKVSVLIIKSWWRFLKKFSDNQTIKAAEPRGTPVWMPCGILSFPCCCCFFVCLSVWQFLKVVFCFLSFLSFVFKMVVQSELLGLVWLLVDYWPHKSFPEAVMHQGAVPRWQHEPAFPLTVVSTKVGYPLGSGQWREMDGSLRAWSCQSLIWSFGKRRVLLFFKFSVFKASTNVRGRAA